MTRVLALLALMVLTGCGGGSSDSPGWTPGPTPTAPLVAQVINQSSLSAADVAAYVEAQNTQLARDFGPAWGVTASVELATVRTDGVKALVICDTYPTPPPAPATMADQGWHDNVTAWCSVVNSQPPTGTWQSTCGKELLEVILGRTCCSACAPYAYPVSLNYNDGTPWILHDFNLPVWYTGDGPGPWDFMGKTPGPGELAPGGINE